MFVSSRAVGEFIDMDLQINLLPTEYVYPDVAKHPSPHAISPIFGVSAGEWS
jgi:hypothetical protein